MNKLKVMVVLFFLTTGLFGQVKEFQVRNLENSIVKKEIPNCLNVKTFYDKVYCSGKVYSVLDDALNGVYKEARKKLTKAQKNRLKKVQRKWIRKRDDKCASVKNNSIILNLTCAKRETVESLIYLNQIEKNPKDFDRLINDYELRR